MPWTSLQTTVLTTTWALMTFSTPASTVTAQSEILASTLNRPSAFQPQLSSCPAGCTSLEPQEWTVYGSFDQLSLCDQPILFDMAIHTPVNDTSTTLKLRACTAGANFDEASFDTPRDESVYNCSSSREFKTTLKFAQQGVASANDFKDDMFTALTQVQTYLDAATDCSKNIMLSYYGSAIVGMYAGQALGKDTASSVMDHLASQVEGRTPASMLTQLCGGQRDADHIFGVAVSVVEDLAAVQAALVSWSTGACANGFGDTTSLPDVSVWEVPQGRVDNDSTDSNSNARSGLAVQLLAADYCKTQAIVEGDTCQSLAKACGITPKELYKYNSNDMCSNLQAGSKVCCTEGALKPQPYDDGTCYTYKVQTDDKCYDIAVRWSLTTDDLDKFNDGTTWGWSGCNNLPAGLNICLSSGYPPMPSELPGAVCGPQAPGTSFDGPVKDASNLAPLNPCPLNSCCNIYGQCGIDTNFCTESAGPTGNPGTSEANIFGCISNCGTDIVNNDEGPSDGQKRVGYYESFNWERECLHMRAGWSNTLEYTHMHWAFGTVDKDMSVYVNDSYSQWAGFMELEDVKKIVSFGGWGVSTGADTYNILRDAMHPDNRDLFISNMVAFAEETGIDGLDIDWEYPGAPDIPGVPPGLDSDAPNYLATLKALRKALPDKYSISIAAPASYWYLKAFPISEMAEVVDYIVYMAYDLHGQWDYGNSFSQAGCENGNCLRSHVNQTEVLLALAMVTKAGVSSNKIMVGESSYGRSFNMAEVGCTGQDCFFTGTRFRSDATPGRCTTTGGYISNAEINELIADMGKSLDTWYDDDTASDYLVYDELQWVAYMGYNTKQARRDTWEKLNFLGTIDWAVDLQIFNAADTLGPSGDYNESSCINVFDNMIWDWVNPVIDAPVSCTNLIQPSPLATTVTRTAYTTITFVSGDSVSTTLMSTAFPISEINYQPFTIDPSDTESGTVITYQPVPRVTPDPMEIHVPAGWTMTAADGEVDSPSSTSQVIGIPSATTTEATTTDTDGFMIFVTWLPTVSYSLPSVITPKIPAPTKIPEDDEHPSPTSNPGVNDCTGDGCTKGPDCTGDDCIRGGDCIGPSCTHGGDCTGPNCVRGGECTGDSCGDGGGCSGGHCVQGGGCLGPHCNKGGECSGPLCKKGGGCVKTIFESCSSGNCFGLSCIDIDCVGMWCDNQVVVTVLPPPPGPPIPTPRPTCLVNCPTLAPCPDGGTSCNEPCNIAKCPVSSMPTAKACTTFTTASDCTKIISSAAVVTAPTTSYSTATRTRCEMLVDCDVHDKTMTTTITTSDEPDPTAMPTGIYDYEDHSSNNQEVFAAIEDDYEEWERTADISPPATTTTEAEPPPTTTETFTQTPEADCAFWDAGFAYEFEIYNIWNWAADGGDSLHEEEDGCGALTGWEWTDATDDYLPKVYFYLPFIMKEGCVERAIASAGGPEISCVGQGLTRKTRSAEESDVSRVKEEQPTFLPASDAERRLAISVYGPVRENGRHSMYIPMDWSGAENGSSSTSTAYPT